MKIALDAQLISTSSTYRAAGVSGYSLQLLRALGSLRLDGQLAHTLHAYVNADGLTVPGVELRHSRISLANPATRILWEQTVLPVSLARHGEGLIHGLVNVLPLASKLPSVVTVHDLSFVRTPEALPPIKRAYLANLCRRSVAKAEGVIAVSQQTADDLITYFGTPAGKIEVIHNGVGAEFSPVANDASSSQSTLDDFRTLHNLPKRYLLFVGTLEPRKNLPVLLRAFAKWRGTTRKENLEIQLVIGGGKGWYFEEIFTLTRELGLEASVVYPGYLDAADLPNWYRAALAFVYPSRFEGFGLPLLEAMASGAPVITTRAPSLLEVAGDAAITVPVDEMDALADAIELVVEQPALRRELARRGLVRARVFSWQAAARATADLYDSIIAQK